MRRGLPRRTGGEPWPPSGSAAESVQLGKHVAVAENRPASGSSDPTIDFSPVASTIAAMPDAGSAIFSLRRGLPRVPGGEPWPSAPRAVAPTPGVVETGSVTPKTSAPELLTRDPDQGSVKEQRAATPTASLVAAEGPRSPVKSTPETSPSSKQVPPQEANRRGTQRAQTGIVRGVGLLVAAATLVLAARWLVSLNDIQDFLTTYPGTSYLSDSAPVGIPGWLAWQHFFNTFFIVLMIRTGWQMRTDKRPRVFWTSRWSKSGAAKISLSLWFHQFLDILWLVNGFVFVVLLFASGQWMRVVPTRWDVFPNAVSAALQYLSLDWPTENGWVNYNGLQLLAYFTTIFIAAPLAAITGVRMSGLWPKNARRLSKVYPVEWARALHFPVMLYFVLFLVIHVTLVIATGALRNLNHMYGGQDSVNWVGFWVFFGSIVLIAGGWFAVRPLVLAPLARVFGRVSGR